MVAVARKLGVEPLLTGVVSLTEKIKEMDRRVEQIARESRAAHNMAKASVCVAAFGEGRKSRSKQKTEIEP